jgi:hypothetical protein
MEKKPALAILAFGFGEESSGKPKAAVYVE